MESPGATAQPGTAQPDTARPLPARPPRRHGSLRGAGAGSARGEVGRAASAQPAALPSGAGREWLLPALYLVTTLEKRPQFPVGAFSPFPMVRLIPVLVSRQKFVSSQG